MAADFPNPCNGNRIVKMVLNEDLPRFLSVCGCQCSVWYRGQPIQCIVCREFGHRAQSCPPSGWCRYCHQPGHMARECAPAWVQVPPAVPAGVNPVTADVDESDSATIIEVDEPVPESDPVTIIVDNPPDPVKPPDKSPVFVDKSSVPVDKPEKATRKSPAADHVKVADKSPVDLPVDKSTKVASSNDVPMTAPQFVSADKSVTATCASVASKSDLPSSVSPAPVPATSSVTAPTSGPSTSVSTARSTTVFTSSSSTSVSSTSTLSLNLVSRLLLPARHKMSPRTCFQNLLPIRPRLECIFKESYDQSNIKMSS